MSGLTENAYRYFARKRGLFYLILLVSFILIGFFVSRITFSEDITRIMPVDEHTKQMNFVFQNSQFMDKLIITVSDSSGNDKKMKFFADCLSDSLNDESFSPYVGSVTSRISEELILDIYMSIYENLPLFLDESDYVTLDSLTRDSVIEKVLFANYKALISPAGFLMKRFIKNDPLGFATLGLDKLRALQVSGNYVLDEGYLMSGDKKNLFIFVVPSNPSGETGNNAVFISKTDQLISSLESSIQGTNAKYFGSVPIAVGNASRIKKDVSITVGIAVILLVVFISVFFKRKRIFLVVFLPAVFGGGLALSLISIFGYQLSTIALGIGSALLGITVDYSLHLFTHYRKTNDVALTIRDLTLPIVLSSITTISAFLCLLFVRSEALHDLGIFASISVAGAAAFALFILPQFLGHSKNKSADTAEEDKPEVSDGKRKYNIALFSGLAVLSVIFIFTATNVGFEGNMSELNYMSDELKDTEKELEGINGSGDMHFVVAAGATLDEALRKTEHLKDTLDLLRKSNTINNYFSIASVLPSDSTQMERIARWNNFWEGGRKKEFIAQITSIGNELNFSDKAFVRLMKMIAKDYQPVPVSKFSKIRKLLLADFIIENDTSVAVITTLKTNVDSSPEIFGFLDHTEGVFVLDKDNLIKNFIGIIRHDFKNLVWISLLVVLLILIIAYGRIELALITFIPMALSWLWTLGIMGAVGLKFTIFNVVISSFIFGLGIDYGIFITQGLIHEHKFGIRNLKSFKTSVLLSAITTLVGVGVLIFAKHPALKSIASLAVIGISSVVFITLLLQPVMFRFLVQRKGRYREIPLAFMDLFNPGLRSSGKRRVDQNKKQLVRNYIYKGPILEWYLRVKLKLEDNYSFFDEILPDKGIITDIGCGYGYMPALLSLCSSERKLYAMDYDCKKISVAANCKSFMDRVTFECADALQYEYRRSDAFVINDVLHYMTEEEQQKVIKSCLDNLNESGVLIIREGNSEQELRHKGTKYTEFWSTKILKFNKTRNELHFTSRSAIIDYVSQFGFETEVVDDNTFTSNEVYIIKKVHP